MWNSPDRIRICQPSLLNFVKKQLLPKIVSRLAAKDGFSMRTITGRDSIQEYITQKGFILPTNLSKTMILILKFYVEKKRNDKIFKMY
jgi:hypothetical protein